jgi:hypothetical protein
VDEARRDRLRLLVVAHFPHLRDVLQRRHEALARRRVVHGGHARGRFAVAIARLQHLDQVQVGIEQRERVREVIGRHHPAAVAGDRNVAGIDARADLGHGLQAVEIELEIQPSREAKT